MILTKRCQSFE